MGADSRFFECTECWSLVRENSRADHEAVHADADKPRYVDCSVCGAQVHLSQRRKHGAWHDRMNRLLDDLTGRVIERAAGPATAQALAATPAASDKDAAISSILRTQSDLAVPENNITYTCTCGFATRDTEAWAWHQMNKHSGKAAH